MVQLFPYIFFIIGAVIGLWALACFVSALVQKGPLGLIRGYFSALSGKNRPEENGGSKDQP